MIYKTSSQSDLASDRAPSRGDRLGVARGLAVALLCFYLVSVGFVAAHRMIRSTKTFPDTLALQNAIGLSTPSWVPSGQPLRNPSGLRRGVDLRFLPQLPLTGPNAIGKRSDAPRSEKKK